MGGNLKHLKTTRCLLKISESREQIYLLPITSRFFIVGVGDPSFNVVQFDCTISLLLTHWSINRPFDWAIIWCALGGFLIKFSYREGKLKQWCNVCEERKVRMTKEKHGIYAPLRLKGATFEKNTT